MNYHDILFKFSMFWVEASAENPCLDLLKSDFVTIVTESHRVMKLHPHNGGLQVSSQQEILFSCHRNMRLFLRDFMSKEELKQIEQDAINSL